MGWWNTQHGMIGDKPADILGKAFRDINEVYSREIGRPMKIGEAIELLRFVCHGKIVVTSACNCRDPLSDSSSPFS